MDVYELKSLLTELAINLNTPLNKCSTVFVANKISIIHQSQFFRGKLELLTSHQTVNFLLYKIMPLNVKPSAEDDTKQPIFHILNKINGNYLCIET